MAAPTITQTITANGGSSQNSVTTASFTPADGSLLVARGSCYAASGDDSSTIAITDSLPLTWTKQRERSQLNDGAGTTPPSIAIWTATGTGAAMTVTTSDVDSTGFSHVLVVWVITGHNSATPVVDTAEEATVTGMALTLVTPVADCLLLGGMCDWGNSSNVPDADANSVNDYALANADIQASWAGHRFVGAAGSYVIGTDALAAPQGTNAVAVAIQPGAGTVTGSATLSAQTSLTAAATNIALGSASMSADTSLTAVGLVNIQTATALSAQSALTVAGICTVFGSATLSAQSSLTASATGAIIIRPSTGTITRPFTGTIIRP